MVNYHFGGLASNSAARRCRSRVGLAILICLGWSMLICSAQAQLRSGRAQRTLYADELNGQQLGTRTPVASRSSSALDVPGATATRRQPQISKSSALSVSGVSADVVPAGYVESHSGGVACDDCGDAFSSTEYLGEASFGCGPLGCDDPGCMACGCADIIPTCSSMTCDQSRGPLMSLWCRLSVRAEVPLYWRRGYGPPPLVTTSPVGTDADIAGELGRSTTTTLLGDSVLDDSVSAGMRISLSTWLGCEQRYGLMFRYWNAGDQDQAYNFDSNVFPVLARPFLDTSDPTSRVQNTQLVAFPGESVGNVAVETRSDVDGLEISLRRLLYQDRFTRVDWLYGYQHVAIHEGLTISSNTAVTGNVPGLQGASIAVTDGFHTENDFHGVSYGLLSTREFACWKMETLLRLGVGNLRRRVDIGGSTTTTSAGSSNTTNQGLLARNTNDQGFEDDTLVVVPELGISFAYCIRPGLDFNVGYNYMLVPKVAQASQQINDNLAVNLSDPLTGPLDPALNFDERRYWINSLGLGLQWRY